MKDDAPSSPTMSIDSNPATSKKRKMDQVNTSHLFTEYVHSSAFVDKTMLIKEVVNNGEVVSLITCPRRFGKTSNMNMIKTFLEIKPDSFGEKLKLINETENYKLFMEREPQLQIATQVEFCNQYLGQYPVIFIDLQYIRGTDVKTVENMLRQAISQAFDRHQYLFNVLTDIINSSNIDEASKAKAKNSLQQFKNLWQDDGSKASEIQCIHSLSFLSQLLHKHFGKKVYILIDEYDAPLQFALNQDSSELEKITERINSFLQATLKSNDHLKTGLLTGISTMVRVGAASGLNNVSEYTFLNNDKFIDFYGFNHAEVLKLCNSDSFTPNMMQNITNWYNGYTALTQPTKHIYNPWSVIQFCKSQKIGNYWEQTGAIQQIKQLCQYNIIRDTSTQLLNTDCGVTLSLLNQKITIELLQELHKLLTKPKDTTILLHHHQLFFAYIFELGYLSFVSDQVSTSSSPKSQGQIYRYKLPNQEIKAEFARYMIDYYVETKQLQMEKLQAASASLNKLITECCKQNVLEFQNSLTKLWADIKTANIHSPTKQGVHPNEDLFHSIINIVLIIAEVPKVGTEVLAKAKGAGRADIVFIDNNIAGIMEIKYDKTAEDAYNQIEKKKYNKIFNQHTTLSKIINMGINIAKDKVVTIKHHIHDIKGANDNSNVVPEDLEVIQGKIDKNEREDDDAPFNRTGGSTDTIGELPYHHLSGDDNLSIAGAVDEYSDNNANA